MISTHASLAGRDVLATYSAAIGNSISTHASLAGRDSMPQGLEAENIKFQPTRPLRDATLDWDIHHYIIDISTHASLAGRDNEFIIN